MRFMPLFAGLLGFSAVASGAGDAGLTTKVRSYSANYTFAGDTPDAAQKTYSVSRALKFRFVGAEFDPDDASKLKYEEDSYIFEYLHEDVMAARADAEREARATGGNADELYSKKLGNVRMKAVDCRLTARKMVERLIGYRVQVEKGTGIDGESHRYQGNRDMLDTALSAKNFDKIRIERDATMQRYFNSEGTLVDPDQNYTCLPTVVRGETALCGDLTVRYNPQAARSGPFQGMNVVIFNKESCPRYSDEMDLWTCELLAQIQGCGLRYTNKATMAKTGRPFQCSPRQEPGIPLSAGLADRLAYWADRDRCDLESGTYSKINASVTPPSQDGATDDAPKSFYDDFKSPRREAK
jgi:hypothetical protein